MFALLALIVGALSSIQGRANGQLGVDIHSALGAAIISNIIGWAILWAILLCRKADRAGFNELIRAVKAGELGWWILLAGIGGTLFVSMQSIAVPEIGVAIFTICIVGGQAMSSLLVDKIGFSSNGKQHITGWRVFSASMTLIAVTIAVYPEFGKSNFKLITVLLCILAGVVGSFQFAMNSQINHVTDRPIVTTWLNFFVGTVFIAVALAVDFAKGGSIGTLPHNPWVYIGGPCGVIFIAVAANVIKSMGVLNFVLYSVTGQLVGALLLDWLIPAHKGALNGYLITGTAITLGSILLSKYAQTSEEGAAKV
ncbi:MAG TPA: DMT family transporter [Candidatus Nanopelagicaceae bacterium]|jgi:transporter family-2 protein